MQSMCALPCKRSTRGRAKRSSCPASIGRSPHFTGQAFRCCRAAGTAEPSLCASNCEEVSAQVDGSLVQAALQQENRPQCASVQRQCRLRGNSETVPKCFGAKVESDPGRYLTLFL